MQSILMPMLAVGYTTRLDPRRFMEVLESTGQAAVFS